MVVKKYKGKTKRRKCFKNTNIKWSKLEETIVKCIWDGASLNPIYTVSTGKRIKYTNRNAFQVHVTNQNWHIRYFSSVELVLKRKIMSRTWYKHLLNTYQSRHHRKLWSVIPSFDIKRTKWKHTPNVALIGISRKEKGYTK